ncbi:bifunctional 4-hydroxy-2-oxoglutarate aldolase/2-dehydro-3-deoxy-phosphogluconate aldolase [Colwellia sp. MEBiC06753]
MNSFKQLMGQQRLLPIIQADSVDDGIAIAKAMKDGGIELVEVVLRTDASLDALVAIKQAFPEMKVGAGTVTSKAILDRVLEAGADFIVTPAISAKLIAELSQVNVPVLPGVSNTGDILLAIEHGFSELKLFPASLSGGHQFIKAVASVFPNVCFCPTGGINQENKTEYLALANCFAVGGTWMVKPEWVNAQDWQKISQACRDAS